MQDRLTSTIDTDCEEARKRDDHPVYVRRLRQADHGALPHESAGQVVARSVREMLRVPVRTEREVLLEGEQTLLQKRLFQVKQAARARKLLVGIK